MDSVKGKKVDRMVVYALEAIKAIEALENNNNVKIGFEELHKEAQEWMSFILSAGLVSTVFFKFSKAKVDNNKQPNKEFIISFLVYQLMAEDELLDKSEDDLLDELKEKLDRAIEHKSIFDDRDEFLNVVRQIASLDTGMIKTRKVMTFLQHFTRLAKVLANSGGNTGNE